MEVLNNAKQHATDKSNTMVGENRMMALPSDFASQQFNSSAQLQDGAMQLQLKGRLDTITAPNLLAFYEKNREILNQTGFESVLAVD